VHRHGEGMAGERLNFIQIIYDEDQRKHCYPFATVYKNEVCTPYFENSVIADIIGEFLARGADSRNDYTAVCSWRLQAKRGDMYRLADKSLTEEKILATPFDIAVLTPRSPTHKPLSMASHWHGSAWDIAFKYFKANFLKPHARINCPEELKHAIYENHFIARTYIYREYVPVLFDAMEFMKSEPEIFHAPSGYLRRKSPTDQAHVKPLLESWGLTDYPIGVFILERLFSIWINDKNFKVIAL